ncbi:MAG: L,D-transpeptidase [Chthoniobacterales bacterium]|nr:L,D-transpeptidase [Chthoniobacterales bacterium]
MTLKQNKKPSSPRYLRISIEQQLLELFSCQPAKNRPSKPIASYPISSSKFGLGTEEGSYRTPLGLFMIGKKIGKGMPERMIFKARKATGRIASLGGEEDHILTRILWLQGLEPHNKNTWSRFIYLHGTNQEELLGTPASHGCIRLGNKNITELFRHVRKGDLVEIA